MAVEGPRTPPLFSELPSSRSNACPTEGIHGTEVAYAPQHRYTPTRRFFSATAQEPSMPVTTSSQSLLASIPSFMSVFGNGPDRLKVNEEDTAAATDIHSRIINIAKRPQANTHSSSPMLRRDSASTFTDSIESSPTTTISTLESSLTEPSPNSPPESPESLLPAASFKNLRTHSVPGHPTMADKDRKEHFSSSFPSLPGLERAESPNKKMRNMKNLSVNTSASHRQGPPLPKFGLSNTSGASHAFSAPPTPAFIVPPKAPRKKPSNLGLTITTPEAATAASAGSDRPSAVPSTPSDHQIRTLRALQISSNDILNSPTVAPEGGMRLPPFSHPATCSRFPRSRPPLSFSPPPSFDSTVSSPITKQTLEHVQEETDYDLPLSQETKSPAYPQGPVCIYDPFVYLYLEPSHIEAREFDVVLNVAREVKNPFTATSGEAVATKTEVGRPEVPADTHIARFAGRDSISEPQTASSEKTFGSSFDEQLDDSIRSAPSTPKAWKPEPEYIHVPWDHNSNVVDDLLRLCELIDNRVRQEKRVLVHCQCGVSRSASLIVAYGLYKNPQLTVQEAYDAVKDRSRWIGPNMNLIYQLSEFKIKLPKVQPTGISAWHSWRSLGSGRSNSNALLESEMRNGMPTSSLRVPPQKSLSAPSLSGGEASIARSNSFSPPGSAQLAPAAAGDITPGPSSAPPDMQWSPGQAPKELEKNAKLIDSGSTTERSSSLRLVDADAAILQSPSTMEREAIEEKESPPAGGIANDLREIAKDLIIREQTWTAGVSTTKAEDGTSVERISAPLEPPTLLDMETVANSSGLLPPQSTKDVGLDSGLPATTVDPSTLYTTNAPEARSLRPMPSLPAGFSSLLTRRQRPLTQQQLPLRPVLVQMPQRAFDPDVPPTPSLLSPRAVEFTASPFHRTAAGDLAGSSVFEQGLIGPKALENDPRSPHQKGETPITRTIFEMI